ncbi:MAG: ABC transporter permease [Candidatus Atabeyarchaeum deiterrae]
MPEDKHPRDAKEVKERAKPVSMWGLAWRRFKRNKIALAGLFIIGYIAFMGIFAEFIAPYGANDTSAFYEGMAKSPPTWAHPFGTDIIGRDLFSEIVFGARAALLVGFGAAGIAIGIAILVGVVAGYYGRYIDEILMRFTEIFLVLPFLLVILVLMQVSEKFFMGRLVGLGVVILIIGVLSWAGNARLIRGEVMRVRELEFITAAKCLGANGRRILFKHIFPNILYLVLVLTTLQIAGAILVEAAVSFLGFGDPNATTWGQILSTADLYISNGLWWMLIFPGIFITLLVLGFNLLGNGLRDAFDPRLRE